MRSLTLPFLIVSLVARAQLPIILHETFDKNIYGWSEHETESHIVAFRSGKYFIQAPEGGWMTYVAPYMEKNKDFSLEATFTQLDGEDNHGIGFLWGHDGKEEINSYTITANGYYKIVSCDKSLNTPDEWNETSFSHGIGKENKLKIEQRKGNLHFYLNDNLLVTTKSFPLRGQYLGFVTHGKMRLLVDDFIFSHDIKIHLPEKKGKSEAADVKENLGPNVNTPYDEVSPKISVDGKTLYFGRKLSPDNVGGITDKEDVWEARTSNGKTWSKAINLGTPVNTPVTNNLVSVSTDNNTLLFHIADGFGFMHRTASGWSKMENLGIYFNNESSYLEGSLSPDGKAIIFVARFRGNVYYKSGEAERDIYVCVKNSDGTWSSPVNAGKVLNSAGDEYSPFLSADGHTLYFATDGRPGYGDVDIFMSRRLSEGWTKWSEPVNLGLGVNTVDFDAYYTLPAAGDYGYMVSDVKTYGLADIVRFKIPKSVQPDPVVLVSGKVLNAKTQKPLHAIIRFGDLQSGKEVGEARSDPRTGGYRIALPAGKLYGYHAAARGYLSVNENLELVDLTEYSELQKDLLLVPIEVGESIQLKNVFFVQSKSELKPESYPELDRLVEIMKENGTMEIELAGHTDTTGDAEANLLLSKKRVEAVIAYLVDKGIKPERLKGKGYGGTRPVALSDTEANRQLNRRVEFKITKK